PCGAALGTGVGAAMEKAKASDPVSIYGGIVGVNRTLDMAVVRALAGIFVEILFAPAYEPDALEELARTKKKCRVFEVPCDRRALLGRLEEYRSVLGGLLAQGADRTGLVRPMAPPSEQAETWFERASEWDADPAQWDDAIDAYRRVVAIDPTYAAAWNNLGLLLHRMGRYDEARASYDRALGEVEDCA